MKPSEKYSSVPDWVRDKYREYKNKGKEEKQDRELKLMKNAPMQSKGSESDSRALDEIVDQSAAAEDQSNYRGYAKGGMVKRAGRGDGCATRGFTKGKMY